jgi:uncharacterized damage-inducible protein DinB
MLMIYIKIDINFSRSKMPENEEGEMLLKDHFDTFARYNAWANARLYSAVSELSEADYRADRGAFFRSIHGTLNHLLATDRIWLQRFTGVGDAPDRLDAILFERFDELRRARDQEDRRITAYVVSLDDAALGGVITYRRVSSPEIKTQALAPGLAHWFNHQTHHRAQVHTMLTGLAGKARHRPWTCWCISGCGPKGLREVKFRAVGGGRKHTPVTVCMPEEKQGA